MATVAYTLCAVTSVVCAILLMREFWIDHDRETRLLFWSSWCFMCFALANGLAFVDAVLLKGAYLPVMRAAAACLGSGRPLVALIWEGE